jgi:hypothetical protein
VLLAELCEHAFEVATCHLQALCEVGGTFGSPSAL